MIMGAGYVAPCSAEHKTGCAIDTLGLARDNVAMTEPETEIHIPPYTLRVGLVPRSETFFQWTIRKSGKMFQRSDRNYVSVEKAWAAGREMIDTLLGGFER
jgi:hypothetical protein